MIHEFRTSPDLRPLRKISVSPRRLLRNVWFQIPATAWFLLGFGGASIALGQVQSSSTDYTLPISIIDGGGNSAFSTDYSTACVFGGFGGVGTIEDSAVTVRMGYCGELNDPPVAPPRSVERITSHSLKLFSQVLMANATDTEHDPLILTSIQLISEKGVALLVDGPWLIYAPPAGFNEPDTITYTISDIYGNSAMGTVSILVRDDNRPTMNILSLELISNPPGKRIRFIGIPYRTYRVQATIDLANPIWITRATRTADSTGYYEYIDYDPVYYFHRFYRAISP
jgi:hypothetical protein